MLLLDYTYNYMDFAASVYISANKRDRSLLNNVLYVHVYILLFVIVMFPLIVNNSNQRINKLTPNEFLYQ